MLLMCGACSQCIACLPVHLSRSNLSQIHRDYHGRYANAKSHKKAAQTQQPAIDREHRFEWKSA